MDYYDNYPHPYGRHDDRVPDDIDGPPPPGFFSNAGPPPHSFGPLAPTSFGPGRDYHNSPPRAHYPHSPDRRHSSMEDFIPAVFPRMDPPTGYSDYGPGYAPDFDRARPPYPPEYDPRGGHDFGPPGYGPPDYDRRPPPSDFGHPDYDRRPPPPDYGHPDYDRRPPPPGYGLPDYDRSGGGHPDYDMRGAPPPGFGHPRGPPPEVGPPGFGHPDYDRRGPPPEVGPGFGHPDYDRRGPPSEVGPPGYPGPPPGYPGEYDRRGPPPPEVYPPPRHHHPDPHGPVFDEPPRFDAAAGRPPPPYEPEPHHGKPAPPIQPSPPRGAPDEGVFPPMPYEPDVASRDVPPPAAVALHVQEEPEALHFPPLPYEPEGGSPAHSHHHHADEGARGLGDYPPEPMPPPRMDPRGDDRAVPYMPDMGIPPPFPDAHYGQATEHGHVKRKHFEGCKDYWAAFLFLLHFWGVVGVCIWLGVRGIQKTNRNEDRLRLETFRASLAPSQYSVPTRLYSIKHWAPQLATAAAAGWVFAFLWQWLVRTETMIKVCLSLGAVSTGLLGIILVSTGTAKGLVGLIFLVAALFQGLYVHLVRHRIPFAATMLNRTRGVVKRHKSLHLISMWTVFLAMFWLAIWIFGVSGAVSLPYGGWYAALLVISLAWSMEVLRNIVYVTVSGVVGQYYYEGRHMHHFPVSRAYRRAWTISFGSVCLGSVFVAPVQALHSMAKRLANEQGANEFLFSCVSCFLGVMEFFNRHFNKWAFVEVGLHGKSFVKSAKQTWQMLKDQDAMLLINDDLTGAILLTSCIIGGVLTALVGGCWTFATYRYLTVGVSILSFVIGFFVTYLTLVVPESAVATYYVCFAEDPGTLKKQDEPLYQYMALRKAKLDQEIE